MRLFDNCPAVVWRGKFEVVLDRDMLPKRKANGEPYPLAHTRYRWIEYTDNTQYWRYYGEYNTYRTKKQAIAEATKADAYLAEK